MRNLDKRRPKELQNEIQDVKKIYRCQCHVACQPPWENLTNFSISPTRFIQCICREDDDLRDVVVAVLRNNYSFRRQLSAQLLSTTSLPTKLSVVSVADGFTPTNLVTSVRKMSLAISSHRHSTAGLWNGNYWTHSQQFLSRQTVSWTS